MLRNHYFRQPKGKKMKKRISMLALVLFVTTLIFPVSDVKAAESDNGMSISAAGNSQDMACGQDKCGDAKEGCDKKKEGCDKEIEGCCKPKEGCGKSGEKKGGCGK
jgi:hypothetical protein